MGAVMRSVVQKKQPELTGPIKLAAEPRTGGIDPQHGFARG